MGYELRDALLRQFDIAWAITEHHLNGLGTDECLWRPAAKGLHVQLREGVWQADWPEHEGYTLGPSSIAWLTWHLVFWWSMTYDHTFGAAQLTREEVVWPGSAESVCARIVAPQAEWRAQLARMDDEALRSEAFTRWPFQGKPFMDVVSWLNIELAKIAAEIGYARFLYAVRG